MEDVPRPTYGIDEVLIRVHRAGICGSDLHIWNWDDWARGAVAVPTVVGHEFAGEMEGENLERRLQALLRILHDEKFSPELESVGDTLKIRLHNCPFRSVALQNKAVCSFDSSLISAALGVDVERNECIQNGHNSCMYTAIVG